MTKDIFISEMLKDFPSIPDNLLEHCVEFMKEQSGFDKQDAPTETKNNNGCCAAEDNLRC